MVFVSENSVLMVVVTGAHVMVMGSTYSVLVVLWSRVRNRQCRGALECRSATAEGFASFCSGPHRPPPAPTTTSGPRRHLNGRATDAAPPRQRSHHRPAAATTGAAPLIKRRRHHGGSTTKSIVNNSGYLYLLFYSRTKSASLDSHMYVSGWLLCCH